MSVVVVTLADGIFQCKKKTYEKLVSAPKILWQPFISPTCYSEPTINLPLLLTFVFKIRKVNQ